MDVSNDTQHVNTVRYFKVMVSLSVENPVSYMVISSTGSIDKKVLHRSLGDVASFKQ